MNVMSRPRTRSQTQLHETSDALFKTPETTPAPAFPFLELPGEIRNIIYGYAIRSRTRLRLRLVHPSAKPPHRWWPSERSNINPALLRVSKQIYHEACPLLYANKISFHDADTFHVFMSQTGEYALQLVNISFAYIDASDYFQEKALWLFERAKKLNNIMIEDLLLPMDSPVMMASWYSMVFAVWIEQLGKRKDDSLAAYKAVEKSSEEFIKDSEENEAWEEFLEEFMNQLERRKSRRVVKQLKAGLAKKKVKKQSSARVTIARSKKARRVVQI